MYNAINPRTQTLGDFHPTLCYPRDYYMGSFPRCALSERGCVIELAPWDFATQCISGDFHPTFVIHSVIFYGWKPHSLHLALYCRTPGTSVADSHGPLLRCVECPKRSDRKTRHRCLGCRQHMCPRHFYPVCSNCLTR